MSFCHAPCRRGSLDKDQKGHTSQGFFVYLQCCWTQTQRTFFERPFQHQRGHRVGLSTILSNVFFSWFFIKKWNNSELRSWNIFLNLGLKSNVFYNNKRQSKNENTCIDKKKIKNDIKRKILGLLESKQCTLIFCCACSFLTCTTQCKKRAWQHECSHIISPSNCPRLRLNTFFDYILTR